LPEEVLVRQAVLEGIGRAVRELYRGQRFDLFPRSLITLLERLDFAAARSNTGASEPAQNKEQR
jgi:hypothetical protein